MLRITWILSFCCIVAAQISETPYSPSSTVREYHTYKFDMSISYAMDMIYRVGPVIGVGILLFLFFTFWSCGRCCNCCHPTDELDTTILYRNVIRVLIILLTLACVGMLIYGLIADQDQSKALNDIPQLITNVILWVNTTIGDVDTLISTATSAVTLSDKIINSTICSASFSKYFNCSSISGIVSNGNTITSSGNSIISDLNQIVPIMESGRSSVASAISTGDSYRHEGMVGILSILFGLIVTQALIALANSFCQPTYQPRKICVFKPIAIVITMAIVFMILIMFFACGLLLGLTTFTADFCISPEQNIINEASISNDILLYYLTCDQINQTNPMQSYVDSVTSAYSETTSFFNAANASFQNCSKVNSTVCNANISSDLTSINSLIGTMFVSIGVSQNGQTTGLLGQLSCANVNGLFQAVFNVVCGDFFISFAATFEVFMVFSCFLAIGEVLRRINPVSDLPHDLRGSQEDDGKEFVDAHNVFTPDPNDMQMEAATSSPGWIPQGFTSTVNEAHPRFSPTPSSSANTYLDPIPSSAPVYQYQESLIPNQSPVYAEPQYSGDNLYAPETLPRYEEAISDPYKS